MSIVFIFHWREFVAALSSLDMNELVWRSITRCLLFRVVEVPASQTRFVKEIAVECFPFRESAPLSGIISHLTSVCGANVHQKGRVRITSSGDFGGKPYAVVDYG
jgi:hypothetical protein